MCQSRGPELIFIEKYYSMNPGHTTSHRKAPGPDMNWWPSCFNTSFKFYETCLGFIIIRGGTASSRANQIESLPANRINVQLHMLPYKWICTCVGLKEDLYNFTCDPLHTNNQLPRQLIGSSLEQRPCWASESFSILTKFGKLVRIVEKWRENGNVWL